MRTLKVKVVVLTDGTNWFVHGASDEPPEQAFAAMSGGTNPIWTFNPETETAHVVELDVILPEFEKPDDKTDIDS